MAAATLQKEKDVAKKDGLKAVIEKDNLSAAADMNLPQEPLPTVVSPPSAPNLTSLLTGHVGQEVGTQAADNTTAKDMDIITQDDKQVDDNVKSPKKKKSKNVKFTKEDKSSKCDRSCTTLKISSFAKPTLAAKPSAKENNFERVFYEAGLELKGEDKYSAYIKQIGTLFENIQLVDPLAIMHAVDELGGTKPLGSKTEMSANMTVFLAYAPVGRNAKAFQPKRNNNRKKGRKGKDEPNTLDPSVYPTMVFLSDVEPEVIISRVTHEFGRSGGFYFQKKQLQCEETVTPFITYFLYTYNDITTLRGELTSLIEEAHQGMKEDFTLPEEFEHANLPDINICRSVPKLPGQPGSNFCDYLREMQEARQAHLIECEFKEIPFLRALISYIKEMKLAVCIWGGHTHITEMVDWDSPKGDISRFVRMSQDHTNYNMSLISIQVKGITNLKASAEVTCPESGNVIGRLSLRQTLLKYLKLQDGNPMCAELHQRGPQGPVDMVTPNTRLQKAVLRCLTSNRQATCIMYFPLSAPPASLSKPFFADQWMRG